MIIAAKSGSMQALGYILDRHSDYINRVVYHIAPWLNKQCREECSQEIMMALMRLIREIQSITIKRNFLAFLHLLFVILIKSIRVKCFSRHGVSYRLFGLTSPM